MCSFSSEAYYTDSGQAFTNSFLEKKNVAAKRNNRKEILEIESKRK